MELQYTYSPSKGSMAWDAWEVQKNTNNNYNKSNIYISGIQYKQQLQKKEQ